MEESEVKNQTFEGDEDVVRCFFRGGSDRSNIAMVCTFS
jgi:hypothetical protein